MIVRRFRLPVPVAARRISADHLYFPLFMTRKYFRAVFQTALLVLPERPFEAAGDGRDQVFKERPFARCDQDLGRHTGIKIELVLQILRSLCDLHTRQVVAGTILLIGHHVSRIADHKTNRIDELLPWQYAQQC